MIAKGFWSILLLLISNVFMTLAWYKHLFLDKGSIILKWGLPAIILLSWGLALFEYVFQVPANRIGHQEHGGPFNLIQLRIIQEVISLTVFTIITVLIFKSVKLNWNHLAAFICLILAVWFVFRK
jgi:uncharacterized protein (DUF486 family)